MGRPVGTKPMSVAARRPQKWRSERSQKLTDASGTNADSSKNIYTKKWFLQVNKDRTPFPDALFETTFSEENINKLIVACKTATDAEVNESRRLLPDDYMYSMHIVSHRAPHVPVHLTRILLPHSVETDESNVCLFVKDLKRGRRIDFEPTILHYEALLKKHNVNRDVTIIPVTQLYNEYSTFELRRKLTYLYDRFLVDKTIASHINGFLGPKLLAKCRSAIPIDLNSNDIANEIDQGMRKVFYKHNNSGVMKCVQIGRHSMPVERMCENIVDLIKQLNDIHPGGTKNIFKLYLKPNVNISVAVPIYVNLEKPENIVSTADTTVDDKEAKDNTEMDETIDAQKASVVGDDIVDEDKDDETKKSPKPKTNQPDEATINEIVLKSLKRLVGNDGISALSKKPATPAIAERSKAINKRAGRKRGPAHSSFSSRAIPGNKSRMSDFGSRGNDFLSRGGNDFGSNRMSDFGGRSSMDYGSRNQNFGSGGNSGMSVNMDSGRGVGFGNSGGFGGGGASGNRYGNNSAWSGNSSFNDSWGRF